jgi:hypothetical protein
MTLVTHDHEKNKWERERGEREVERERGEMRGQSVGEESVRKK